MRLKSYIYPPEQELYHRYNRYKMLTGKKVFFRGKQVGEIIKIKLDGENSRYIVIMDVDMDYDFGLNSVGISIGGEK